MQPIKGILGPLEPFQSLEESLDLGLLDPVGSALTLGGQWSSGGDSIDSAATAVRRLGLVSRSADRGMA